MSFDPVTYSAVQQLKKVAGVPIYEYIWSSKSITVARNAELTIRAMGAGGGGSGVGGGSKGGCGGTVALKTLNVAAGDTLNVTIPAGGSGLYTVGGSGGTLQIQRNGSTILTIAGGGGGGGTPTANPTGADWFVKSTAPTGVGGGSAMILEGFDSTGTATAHGGAGVLGNGGSLHGGGLMYSNGGGGFALVDMTVLRFTENIPTPEQGGAFSGGTNMSPAGGFGAGGCGNVAGGKGGFGGGGGGGGGSNGKGSDGGYGGGGGGSNAGGTSQIGGSGGQGWITLEWRYTG